MYKRELFTIEQCELLDHAIRNKHWSSITSLFAITEPTQEYEIQRLLRENGPVFRKAIPSKVEHELQIELSKNPQLLSDPAVEKEWQEKLDAERREIEREARGETKDDETIIDPADEKKNVPPVGTGHAPVVGEDLTKLTKKELLELLKGKDVKLDGSETKASLIEILKYKK